MRIVKKDASIVRGEESYIPADGNKVKTHTIEYVRLSDIIAIREDWRPEGYIVGGGYDKSNITGQIASSAFETGFSACIKALGEL